MSWSRFLRMCVLTGVWATAAYVVSQSAIARFRRRRVAGQPAHEPIGEPVRVQAQPARSRAFLSPTMQRNGLLFVVALFVVGIVGQALFSHIPVMNVFSAGRDAGATGATFIIQPPTTTVARTRPFETGIVTPQWQQQKAYGPQWQQSLADIQAQTDARWIEFSLLFSQSSSTSTTVRTTQSTPLVAAFAAGVRAAHAKGLHVFVVPLMGVDEAGGWAGSINFASQAQEQAWFDSYWNTYKPYVEAAEQAGADQMAIATECSWLQQHAPAALWSQLITRVRGVFAGTLTYDMNWYPVNQPIPTWFSNPNISMIGVSAYIPLADTSIHVDPKDMAALWSQKIRTILDTIATRSGKPVLISEIGYRNSTNALYHSWEQTSTAPVDNAEQAGAFDAALTNVLPDQRIAGIFFWGWEDVGMFTLKGQDLTTSVLHKWYSTVGA